MRLPERLKKWDGAARIHAGLLGKGFLVPEKFLRFTAAVAKEPEGEWSRVVFERARGWLTSGGLREKAKAVDKFQSVMESLVLDEAVRAKYGEARSRWKSQEVPRSDILASKWPGTRAHLRTVAQRVAASEGLELTKKGYRVEGPEGLFLDVEVDVGRPGSTLPSLAIFHTLRSQGRSWSALVPWGVVAPGMEPYPNDLEPVRLVWGIRAFVCFGQEFMKSLG